MFDNINITDDLKNLAIEKSTIEDVAADFLPVSDRGSRVLQTCHCCGKKNKLEISKSKQIFTCFNCGVTGNNAISYLMRVQGLSYQEALRFLVDRYSIDIPDHSSEIRKKRPQGVSFRDQQIKSSGIPESFQKYTIKRSIEDGHEEISLDRYERGSVDRKFNRIDGDDMIINYLDFNFQPIKYRTDKSNREHTFFRIRYAIPEQHKNSQGKAAKYRSPYGAGNHLYLPNFIINAVREFQKFDTLYICEGEKKADKLCVHEMPAVGIAGIHNFNPKAEMPKQLERIIRDCEVKRVVFLVDSDWEKLSLKPGESVDLRPHIFSRAVIKFREYFRHYSKDGIFLDMFFGYHLDNIHKGIDDLMVLSMKGKEDQLKSDFENALLDREGHGEFVRLHKITSISDYQIREIWKLHSMPAFIEHHKEELKKLKEFRLRKVNFCVNEDGEIDLAQKIQPNEQFWTIRSWEDKSGKERKEIKFAYQPARIFLRNRGFGKLKVNGGEYAFVYVEDKIVRKVDSQEIRDFVLEFVEHIDEPDVLELLLSGSFRYFGDAALHNMYDRNIEFMQPEKGVKFLVFKSIAWKISEKKIDEVKLTDLPGHIWADQVIDFEPKRLKDRIFELQKGDDNWDVKTSKYFEKSDIAQFIYKTSIFFWRKNFSVKEDVTGNKILVEKSQPEKVTEEDIQHTYRHMIAKILSIGYVLQDYKDFSNLRAIVAMDGAESEVGRSEGGTGKSIFAKMFEKILPTSIIDAKNKNLSTEQFLYDGVEDTVKLIVLDDCRVNIDFEHFYSQITSKVTINWKGKTKFDLYPPPYFIFTTNHAINGRDNSSVRRQYTVAFSDYFGAWRTPKDEFGHQLMVEWDELQWNLYYNFIAQCAQSYLKFGLHKVIDERSIKRRKLRQEIGESVIDWCGVTFANSYGTGLNHKVDKVDAYDSFKRAYPQDARYIDVRKFKQRVKTWCEYTGLDFNPDQNGSDNKSGGREYFVIANDEYDTMKCDQFYP